MKSYEETLAKCLSAVQHPLAPEPISVWNSLGRILREPILSPHAMPPFLHSVMDGYAVMGEDLTGSSPETPCCLKVVGTLPAGKKNGKRICQGQAMRIMTGAPLPDGANAVVILEHTVLRGDQVTIFRELRPGENVAPAGEHATQGQLILGPGIRIGPAEMGILSACGKARVRVAQRPRIGIVSTGDELAAPGAPLGAAQIYDINGHALFGLGRQYGANTVFLGIAGDRDEELQGILDRSRDLDMLLISGGGALGDYDIVRHVLLRAGIRKIVWHAGDSPGKPLFLGRRGEQLVFCLPGKPISSMLNFLLFIKPVLDKMMGRNTLGLRPGEAVVTKPFRLKPGQNEFLCARLVQDNGTLGVRVLNGHKFGGVHFMIEADALLEVPKHTAMLNKGDKVKILHLD